MNLNQKILDIRAFIAELKEQMDSETNRDIHAAVSGIIMELEVILDDD